MNRPDSPSWLEAKAAGDVLEERLAAFFRLRGFDVLRPHGHAPGFDLEIRASCEAKADRQAERTGNVAIEVECRGRPSGIAATRADFYAIDAAGLGLWVPIGVLHELVESGNFREANGGDGKRSRLVLVPVEALREAPGVRVLWQPGD